MENFEKNNLPPSPTEENLRHLEELERKKQVKRENRLKKIVESYSELLQSFPPEEAGNFEIVCEEMQEKESSMLSNSDLPAYGVFLKLKSNPEKKYQIAHWLKPDLDAKKSNFDMLLNQKFTDRIKKGIEELKIKD